MRSCDDYELSPRADAALVRLHRDALEQHWSPQPILSALVKTFQALALNPHSGTKREDLGPGYRVRAGLKPAKRYVILFRDLPERELIQIITVIHGSRDWPTIFAERFREEL